MDMPARVHASSAGCMLFIRLTARDAMTSPCTAGGECPRRTTFGDVRIYAVLATCCSPFPRSSVLCTSYGSTYGFLQKFLWTPAHQMSYPP